MLFTDYSVSDRIATITLNRPDKRNALNAQFITELKKAFAIANSDPKVRVILLKAKGEAFCAGADLEYLSILQANTLEENKTDSQNLKELFLQIYSSPKITIAQAEGHAIAGGCGLATVCDFVFSIPEALYGYTEVKIGFIPALVSIFLTRKIGEGKAKQILLTGKLLTAKEAHDIGLINYLEQKESIGEKVINFASELCSSTSGQSVALTKKLMNEVHGLNLEESLNIAAIRNAEARETMDCKKGIKAFLNKEKMTW